jgi:hypothetical protein
MGNANLEEQDKKLLELDVVDEQLDVIGKGILAQTITCARCHDHKFDPIPTRDYYGMAGILKNSRLLEHANVSKWIEVALPLQPEEEKKYAEADAKIAAMEAQVRAMKAALGIKPTKAGGAIDPKSLPGIVVDDAEAKVVGEWTASKSVKPYIGSGYLHDANDGKGDKTITFIPKLTGDGQYEVRLAYTTGKDRATNVHVTLFTADGEKEVLVNQKLAPPIDGMFISLGTHRFEFKGQSYVMVSNEATDGVVTVDAVQFIPVDESLAAAAREPEVKLTEKPTMAAMKKLEAEAKELAKNKPKRPSVVGMRESGKCEDMPIHIRGSVQNVGDVVPRGFLQVASFDAPPTFSSGESGRRELAEWLASPRNPLTARVMTNRVWHWLFGVGLVRTTDNFGTTGEAPSHPELLDYLATQFIEHGWSVKHMVRLIVTSHTYRLSTAGDERNGAADPENRLLWRMNRRRLDAECLRDAMLTVSGKLEPCSGGQTFDPVAVTSDYKYDGKCNYRSVYVPVFRNNLPEIFEVFDFADPSSVTGARNVSTVVPQALYLRNHPFVIEQAGAAAKQVDGDEAAALEHAYQVCLGRSPTPAESKLALDYLARATDKQRAWTQVYQAIFASIDFRYLD